jgi:hypothetical protein
VVLGKELSEGDEDGDGFVNGPLKAGTAFTFRLVACTANGNDFLCQASELDPVDAVDSTTPEGSGGGAVVIAVGAVAAVAAVAVVVGLIVVWRRRASSKTHRSTAGDQMHMHVNPVFASPTSNLNGWKVLPAAPLGETAYGAFSRVVLVVRFAGRV